MKQPTMRRLVALLLGLLCGAGIPGLAAADPSVFARPAALEPRIAFWTRVYTEVGTDGGLLHDAQDLGVVYEVISVPTSLSKRGRERRIDGVRDRYKKVLRRLAEGRRSGLSSEEQRVLALFPPGVSDATLRSAARRIRFQLGQANKFRAGLVRMGRWEDYIGRVLEERGLPAGLIALPHVESSYNPKAYSHAGAAGLWQFTRSTGRRYMRVDHIVDERRDPYVATVSAARLLKDNYRSTGSWPLAITAYNHGAAGMRRAARTLGTQDIDVIVARYKSRSFGFASRNFYSEFLAALDVETNPTRYFGPIEKDLPVDPRIVVLDHHYKVSSLARAFGLSLDDLRELNPALRTPVWKESKLVPKAYGLRLPDHAKTAPQVVLAGIPAAERYSEQIRDRRYRVRRGDTLSRIAKRMKVSESELMRANNLRNRNRIRVGQMLEIPGQAEPARAKKAKAPSPGTRKKRTGRTARASASNAPAIPAGGVYRVRRGDSLASIAKRFGVSQRDLASVNRIRNRNRIQVGQVLQVPGGSTSAAPASSGHAQGGVYTVRKGDTLDSIARRFGVRQQQIVERNRLRSRHRIRVGQILYLPAGTKPPAQSAAAEPTEARPVKSDPPAPEPPKTAPQVAKTNETKPTETVPTEQKTAEAKPTEGKAAEAKPTETVPTEQKTAEAKPTEGKAAEAKPTEGKAAETVPRSTAGASRAAATSDAVREPPAARAGTTQIPEQLPLAPDRYRVGQDDSIEVRPEETLGHYAEWLDLSAQSLRQRNRLTPGRPLQLGRRLQLDFRRVSKADFEALRIAHHRQLQSRFYGEYQISGTRKVVIRRGDTLWELARRHDPLPVWLLFAYNPNIDLARLRAGQKLTIPRLEPRG